MEIPGDYQIDDWSCRTVLQDRKTETEVYI